MVDICHHLLQSSIGCLTGGDVAAQQSLEVCSYNPQPTAQLFFRKAQLFFRKQPKDFPVTNFMRTMTSSPQTKSLSRDCYALFNLCVPFILILVPLKSFTLMLNFHTQGIHEDIKCEAWKYLLGFYKFDSTYEERGVRSKKLRYEEQLFLLGSVRSIKVK